MKRFLIRRVIGGSRLFLVFLVMLASCSQKSADKTASKKSGAGVSPTSTPFYNDPNANQNSWNNSTSSGCTKTNCPASNVSIRYRKNNNSETGALRIAVNDQLDGFEAYSNSDSDRSFVIYKINSQPNTPGMGLQNSQGGQSSLTWRVRSNDARTGTLTFYVRDVTRCQTLEPTNRSNDCSQNFTSLTTYNSQENLSWSINGAVGNGNNNNMNSVLQYTLPIVLQRMGGGTYYPNNMYPNNNFGNNYNNNFGNNNFGNSNYGNNSLYPNYQNNLPNGYGGYGGLTGSNGFGYGMNQGNYGGLNSNNSWNNFYPSPTPYFGNQFNNGNFNNNTNFPNYR